MSGVVGDDWGQALGPRGQDWGPLIIELSFSATIGSSSFGRLWHQARIALRTCRFITSPFPGNLTASEV